MIAFQAYYYADPHGVGRRDCSMHMGHGSIMAVAIELMSQYVWLQLHIRRATRPQCALVPHALDHFITCWPDGRAQLSDIFETLWCRGPVRAEPIFSVTTFSDVLWVLLSCSW